jgi:protein-S-isoprenylcysteine O-methyltransferase Ste14
MPDERSGTVAGRVARLRVPLGFLFGAVVLWLATPTMTTLSVGVPMAVLGEALRIWAAGHLIKSEEVTRSGPYRWFAHPLYVGSSVIGVGVAAAAGSVTVAVLIAVYLGTTITAAIRHEEAFLQRKFGRAYVAYRSTGIASDARAEGVGRAFSLSRAVANREYRAAGGLAGAVLLMLWKAAYNGAF